MTTNNKKEKEKPSHEWTMMDRAVAWASPSLGKKRLIDRKIMALSGGGYHGGSNKRSQMKRYQPGEGSPDVDINLDLAEMRGRTRDLTRNEPVATAAVGTSVTNIVGTGLTMHPRIDREALGLSDDAADKWETNTRREWNLWAESRFCDVTGKQNFFGLQALAFRSMLESGDVFALTPMLARRNFPYELAIQLIEADRVSNPHNAMDSDKISGGIGLGTYGEATSVFVTNTHPGNMRNTVSSWKEVGMHGDSTGRKNVIHLFEQLRPGQVRGVPFLAPIIEMLKQLGRYTDAELNAAVISGSFAVFMQMDAEAFNELFQDNDQAKKAYVDNAKKWDGGLDSGKAVNLLPGETVVDANPGRPNSEFDPFVTSIMRQIGMALEIPYEVLVMHFQSSYSAARGALLQAWRVFRKRREWFAADFCQPIYELWLHEAVSSGRISAPGYFNDALVRASWNKAQWTGDGPGSIDEVKAAKGAELRMNIGLTTLEEETILLDGGDWQVKNKQQIKEKTARAEGGLLESTESPADEEKELKNIDDDEFETDEAGGVKNDKQK